MCQPPREGRHGYVEPLFRGELKQVSYGQEKDRVDFRERYEIEQVDEGDVIATIHKPVPGEAGMNVAGQPVEPPPVRNAGVRYGNGTAPAHNGTIKATRKGMPSYKKGREFFIQVDDVYIHKGNVDIKSGSLNFKGHLEIKGSLLEGMKVMVDGNLVVGDSSAGATVLAGGNIVFKNQCIRCEVRAGWKDTILLEIYETLEQLTVSLERALDASNKVIQVLEEKEKFSEWMEPALIRSLLQSKFTEIPDLAASLTSRIKEAGAMLTQNLEQVVSDNMPLLINFNYNQSLCRSMLAKVYEEMISLVKYKGENFGKSSITASYVQNSSLTCTGDIIIHGSGVYNSKFKCGGDVRIKKVFRGGSIEAGGEVQIGEAGSPRLIGDQGVVKVPKYGKVYLGKAYDNFYIIFGEYKHILETAVSGVCFSFDSYESKVKDTPWRK